jgi:hypothetical protein
MLRRLPLTPTGQRPKRVFSEVELYTWQDHPRIVKINAGTKVVTLVVACAFAFALVFFFVPLVGVEAAPPKWQYYVTTSTIQGGQTHMVAPARNPRAVGSTASLAFCLLGRGALLQDGTYYIYTSSHLQVQGSFCPTPR